MQIREQNIKKRLGHTGASHQGNDIKLEVFGVFQALGNEVSKQRKRKRPRERMINSCSGKKNMAEWSMTIVMKAMSLIIMTYDSLEIPKKVSTSKGIERLS